MTKQSAIQGVGTRSSTFSVVEVDDGAFDYDDRVMIETSQKNSRSYWIRPVGGVVNQEGPFTFTIEPFNDRYIQLNRAGIEMRCKLVKADGSSTLPWSDVAAPINMLGPCMWESVQVMLNGRPFSGASQVNAGYKAFLETMLSYDADSRDSHLHSQFFHLDSPRFMDRHKITEKTMRKAIIEGIKNEAIAEPTIPDDIKADPDSPYVDWKDADAIMEPPVDLADHANDDPEEKKLARRQKIYQDYYDRIAAPFMRLSGIRESRYGAAVNKGFENRFNLSYGSVSFDMYSPITHDFFKLNNHIGPGNKIDVILTRYPDAFLINTDNKDSAYKIVIEDMRLHLHTIERRERVPPPVIERYLMNETQLHKQVVARGTQTAQFRIHHGGTLPKTVLVSMATTRAVDGAFDRNPWNLHHFFIDKLALIVNGEVIPDGTGLEFDFTRANPLVSRSYRFLFENSGAADSDKGNCVSWKAYQAGTFIQAFDLTPDKCNGLHNHESEYGFIDLEVHFARELWEPIYILYETVFPKMIINDKMSGEVDVIDVGSS